MFVVIKRLIWRRRKLPCYCQAFPSHCLAGMKMEQISAFVKDAICIGHCLERCLYIHGVPGTGKTMSVLVVMRKLRYELDCGTMWPNFFREINGLKLPSPENIYKIRRVYVNR